MFFQCGTSLGKAYLCGLSQHLSNVGTCEILSLLLDLSTEGND
jgi:hypothetical protein